MRRVFRGLVVKGLLALAFIGSVQLGSHQWTGQHFHVDPVVSAQQSRPELVTYERRTVINPLGLPVDVWQRVDVS